MLLLHRVLQVEGVGNDFVAGLDAGNDLLLVAGEHVSGNDFQALEAGVAEPSVNPLAVMEVQDRTGWQGRAHFRSFPVKRSAGKHADPEHSRILNL